MDYNYFTHMMFTDTNFLIYKVIPFRTSKFPFIFIEDPLFMEILFLIETIEYHATIIFGVALGKKKVINSQQKITYLHNQ